MCTILQTRTQQTDYMENILGVITINHTDNEDKMYQSRGTMNNSSIPFRPFDIR